MRRPHQERRLSLRSPVDEIAQIANHIDIAGMPSPQRRQLLRRAALFNKVMAGPGGAGFKTGIKQLLHLSREEARAIARSYIACPTDLRRAIGSRLVHLGLYAEAPQIRSFLKLISKLDQPVAAAFDPLLSRHPELRTWIGAAKRNFKADPREALDHIMGDVSPSNIQLAGGGHLLETIEQLAEARLSTWTVADRQRFDRAVAALDPEIARQAIISAFGSAALGFDLSDSRWAKFFLKEQLHWFIATRTNGVRCFRIPRLYFNSGAWRSTIASARGGTSPVGGKSLFPRNWARDEIEAAVIAVLEHPEPVVLRRRVTNGIPHFYLRSKVGEVDVEVGLNGDKVGTAFPSWRQYHPATIGQAYLEWYWGGSRLKEGLEVRAREEPLFFRLSFPHGFIEAYLNNPPDGMPADEWDHLKKWLCPAFLSEAPVLIHAASLQLIIFEWLERSRVVQELEGVEGPVR